MIDNYDYTSLYQSINQYSMTNFAEVTNGGGGGGGHGNGDWVFSHQGTLRELLKIKNSKSNL